MLMNPSEEIQRMIRSLMVEHGLQQLVVVAEAGNRGPVQVRFTELDGALPA